MTKYYHDYFWKEGKPRGLAPVYVEPPKNGIAYKIVADPYYKRISIEKYEQGAFSSVVYDSALFDFRHLKPAEQNAWQKISVKEWDNSAICHIRNHDDRLILIEEYLFDNQLCRQCRTSTPHGVLVSIQKISYESLRDPFNGATLFDSNDHVVMFKRYKVDEETQTFLEVIEECWNMGKKDEG